LSVFASIAVPAVFREAVSERAWLGAMLETERALASAEARAGLIPQHAADAIAEQCRTELYDWAELAERGRKVANPAEPLVRALRAAVGGEAATYVHWGATSQDVVDTAAMLVARRALDLHLGEFDGVAAACAWLARDHRSTPMAGRTLLQQAVPITFGLKAASWLTATLDARRSLVRIRHERLAAQFGGAAGTLAPLGDQGAAVLELFAAELGLTDPGLPWHTNRGRIAELGAALDIAAGVCAKIGLDVTLLAQTEVAEVAEGDGGASSTMPQKRNPVGSTLAKACAVQVHALAGVLTGGLAHELERATGAWQAEWDALAGALALSGAAAVAIRGVLDGLEVDPARMRGNLVDATMAERIAFRLAGAYGGDAHDVVADALASGRTLREAVAGRLDPDDVEAALDPTTYLGSAEEFVDRALARFEQER
jgi:3-carboxy-cis,cis-muconate cycloisomerase